MTQAEAEPETETDPESVGQTLRIAREAQKLSVGDVALRLRLMQRQIEAIESDDFDSLGQPVFARGFVRNYARLLGLAPEPLLQSMGGGAAEPTPVTQAEPPLPSSWLTSPWLILMLIGVLVIIAIPVSLYLWLNSDVEEGQTVVPAVTEPRFVSPPPALIEPVPAVLSTETPADPAVPAMTEPDAETNASAPIDATVARSVVRFEFGEDSWVDVKDATGRMLHRQLNLAGSNVEIYGRPPFAVVIGNATQTRMTYNGRLIDLKPFIDVTVARFTLEE